MAIRVSLSEQDFRNLVLGDIIEAQGLTDSEEKVYLKISLNDIGLFVMQDAIEALALQEQDGDNDETPPSKSNDRNDAIEGG